MISDTYDSMTESSLISAEAERLLPLSTIELSDDYYYQSLPLCIIDAVYSINVRYESVRRVVARYCQRTGQRRVRLNRRVLPAPSKQESVGSFCSLFDRVGVDAMTSEYFQNRQRTSTVNGILKSEAVFRFASALKNSGVDYFQDVANVSDNATFESAIRSIPGQRSGISLQYFWMLAGSDNVIKPDRMVVRFLQEVLGRPVLVDEAPGILRAATETLKLRYPQLTPRVLDYAIWVHQRR